MGWNISFIVGNERARGYLGCFPEHSAVEARQIIRKLYLPATNTSSLVDFERGLNPDPGWFAIGAYPGAALISGAQGLVGCVSDPECEFIRRFIKTFPKSAVLAIDLAGANNYFAYALYENSLLVRM